MATASSKLSADEFLRRLECPVCHEHFRSPKMLPCGHTLCRSPCLEQIINSKPKVRCPECRTEHDVPQTGVDGFPNNVAVSRMMEDKASTKHRIHGCPICGDDELLVMCAHCDLKICEECKLQHTPKLRQQLLNLVGSFKEELQCKSSACSDLENFRKVQIRSSSDIANSEIDNASKRLISGINSRTKELKRQVSAFVVNENENVDLQHVKYRKIIEQSSTFCDDMLCELSSDTRLAHVRLARIKGNLKENKFQVDQSNLLFNKEEKQNISVQLNIEQVENDIENMGDVHVLGTAKTVKCKAKLKTLDIMNKNVVSKLSFRGLCYPIGIAKHPTSNDIYVVDNNNHRIQCFHSDGSQKFSFGSEGCANDDFKLPVGIIYIKSGCIVITDQNNHRIKVYDHNGKFLRAFGKKGDTLGMLHMPLGLAQDHLENIHICDSINKRVQVFNEHGDVQYEYCTWKSVAHQFVRYISINDSGMIAIQLKSTIVVLDRSLTLMNSFPTNHGSVNGLCLVGDSRIIASDNNECKLKVYTLDGDLVRDIDISGDDTTKRRGPTGIDIDGDDIYVAFCTSNVVVKF